METVLSGTQILLHGLHFTLTLGSGQLAQGD